ncbi:Uncharacterised protein [Actinomyces bovis]|uniref:Uncharacterized protein n=1 Tax=Actinomyces bovis TaxID=1658 RepID=A0ABY1VLF3_9ACTO|nr:hypothetical protein [Actinomyces bovis]SPT52915.1 Uncharacterised protein [Actinomyces bovis]VEG55069.1 Uncharacterised protein [Actinomyces israelii]
MSKPKGKGKKVQQDKETARKVSAIINSSARLIRAVSVLLDALGKWFD